jgi:sugar/nucleoside kinase (ribokinase family)
MRPRNDIPVKRPRIVVVGGYNAELFVTCSQLPTAQRIFMGGPLQIFGDGRGANMAVAAARAGLRGQFRWRVRERRIRWNGARTAEQRAN